MYAPFHDPTTRHDGQEPRPEPFHPAHRIGGVADLHEAVPLGEVDPPLTGYVEAGSLEQAHNTHYVKLL
jgi:hypothetical protein